MNVVGPNHVNILLGEGIKIIGFQGGTVVKNPPANAGDTGDVGSIPGLGRSLGGRNSNPLQYSCLENPTDKGVWRSQSHSP